MWPQESRNISLSYGIDKFTNDYFFFVTMHAFDRLTDGQTDRLRRTDRQTETDRQISTERVRL